METETVIESDNLRFAKTGIEKLHSLMESGDERRADLVRNSLDSVMRSLKPEEKKIVQDYSESLYPPEPFSIGELVELVAVAETSEYVPRLNVAIAKLIDERIEARIKRLSIDDIT